jgi:type IX secretion system PorP/SprF family membrane protein
MKMNRSHIIPIIMTVILSAGLSAPLCSQDIHFSQFQNSPLNLNPARTGIFDGDIRFVGNYRNQWKSVSQPYTTFSGSVDAKLNRWSDQKNIFGAGLVLFHDKAGDSKLSSLFTGLSVSWTRILDRDGVHALTGGLQIGFNARSIDYSGLTFDEQYDGDVFNPDLGNTESFDGNNHGFLDLAAGLVYTLKLGDETHLGAGVSMQHLNKPDDSFFGESVAVPTRLQVDLLLDARLSDRFDLVPTVLYQSQGSAGELVAGTSLRININDRPGKLYNFYVGGFLRMEDAIILSAGLDYNFLHATISYDINTSDLDRASNNKGGPELSLIYIIKKVKPLKIKPPCPVY